MRYPEQVLCRKLAATPAVARLLGFRIFPMMVPASAQLPFATYQRTGVVRQKTLTVPAGVPTVTVAINFYAESYQTVRELADSVREALDHYRGTVQGVAVSNVTIEDESESVVDLEGGDLPPAWQVSMVANIEWQEVQ